jgi:hypothetical protein
MVVVNQTDSQKKKRPAISNMIGGMESIQYLLGFMDTGEVGGKDQLLYTLNHLRYLKTQMKEDNRLKLLISAEEYTESLISTLEFELAELQKMEAERALKNDKVLYIVDHITIKGTSGKEYWTLSEWAPYGKDDNQRGTCNEYGFTDQMPEGFEKRESMNVCLGIAIRNSKGFKGETVQVDGCLAAVIKLKPELCKPKKTKLTTNLLPLDKTDSKKAETVLA